MLAAGATEACRTAFDPLLIEVRAHGFHGFMMDVREHADVHAAVMAEVASQAGIAPFDAVTLRQELLADRRLIGPEPPLTDAARRALDTFRAIDAIQAEAGEPAASTYIVSMTTCAEDLLRVLLLARKQGS